MTRAEKVNAMRKAFDNARRALMDGVDPDHVRRNLLAMFRLIESDEPQQKPRQLVGSN